VRVIRCSTAFKERQYCSDIEVGVQTMQEKWSALLNYSNFKRYRYLIITVRSQSAYVSDECSDKNLMHCFQWWVNILNISKKVKQSRYTPWRRLGGEEYRSYSFTTSALDGDEWSASRPGRALPPGKGPPVPIVQEGGWAPEPVWTQRIEEKSFAPAEDRTPVARSSSP
jgi:hypothetical protein